MVESIRRIAIITPLLRPDRGSKMPDGAAPTTAPPTTATQATPFEIIHVDSRTVACDGGDGALGHPRVFLRIPGEQVMCPYCSRLYILNPGADHASGH
jgi:uncharacterized Zn-finger protein